MLVFRRVFPSASAYHAVGFMALLPGIALTIVAALQIRQSKGGEYQKRAYRAAGQGILVAVIGAVLILFADQLP